MYKCTIINGRKDIVNTQLSFQNAIHVATKQGATYIHVKEQRYLENSRALIKSVNGYKTFNIKV